ncbi:golgin-45 [Sitophilus oryzae]|uniref:Golgin-45 n=1 Tax=Sitophilus oryzae TaxID=7048 RepID=A0A6J2XZD1_SITOR|nr:golgin-45 [Sitophilus oryzae]
MNLSQYSTERTSGDGMENNVRTNSDIKLSSTLLTKPSSSILKSMKPVEPASKIFNLVPKYVPQDKKVSNIILYKPKEPKFIPYEPYKAAVIPIIPTKFKKPTQMVYKEKRSKNNIEIHELVNQMTDMRTKEMNKLGAALPESAVIPLQQWEKEKEAFDTDIKNLKETKAHLENQLKFQAQVNSELKTLLVAAVGEDLETRVQHLTEDKLSLARALLNSANHLTSHQEQTEWLSGQCEVWRSKFLASSLMVEELARWKSALTKRVNDLQEVTKKILSEHNKLQKQMLTTYTNLNSISEKQTGKGLNIKIGDIIELGAVNQNLSRQIADSLQIEIQSLPEKPPGLSVTEKLALKVLKNPVTLTSQDVLCNALVGAAHSLTGDPRFVENQLLHPCCSHCKGEVQDI